MEALINGRQIQDPIRILAELEVDTLPRTLGQTLGQTLSDWRVLFDGRCCALWQALWQVLCSKRHSIRQWFVGMACAGACMALAWRVHGVCWRLHGRCFAYGRCDGRSLLGGKLGSQPSETVGQHPGLGHGCDGLRAGTHCQQRHQIILPLATLWWWPRERELMWRGLASTPIRTRRNPYTPANAWANAWANAYGLACAF